MSSTIYVSNLPWSVSSERASRVAAPRTRAAPRADARALRAELRELASQAGEVTDAQVRTHAGGALVAAMRRR